MSGCQELCFGWIIITLKELINAALIFAELIFADKGLSLKVFCGTNYCGCLDFKYFATHILRMSRDEKI